MSGFKNTTNPRRRTAAPAPAQRWGGARTGAGRHPKTCACERCQARRATKRERTPREHFAATLPPEMVEYMKLWHPANISAQLEELVGRAMRMWPAGPTTNPSMSAETLERHRQAALASRDENR